MRSRFSRWLSSKGPFFVIIFTTQVFSSFPTIVVIIFLALSCAGQKRKRELFFFQKTAPTRARQRPQERDKRAQQLVDSLRQYTEQPPLLLGELFKPLLRKLEAPLLPFS